MNREIKTDLFNIFDLIVAAHEYGYGDDVFYCGMFDMIRPLTDKEIKEFGETYLTPEMREKGYTEEDAESAIKRLTELAAKYNGE